MRPSLFLSMLLLFATATEAAVATRFAAADGSAVVLAGSSNVAPWRCQGASMEAVMVVATSAEHINDVIDRIEDGNIAVWMANPSAGRFPPPSFTLRIPVSTFRCGNRIMESDLRTALSAQQHPNVEFLFRDLSGVIHHDLDSGLYRAEVGGALSLAGVTRNINLPVTAQRLSRSRFRLRAELPLRMTDFGVTPPSALFGAIRARDALTVSFDLVLEVAAAKARP